MANHAQARAMAHTIRHQTSARACLTASMPARWPAFHPGEGANSKGTVSTEIDFDTCIDCRQILLQVCPVERAILAEEKRPDLQRR